MGNNLWSVKKLFVKLINKKSAAAAKKKKISPLQWINPSAVEVSNSEDAQSFANIFFTLGKIHFFSLCHYLSEARDTSDIWLCSWNECKSHPEIY